MIEENIVNFLAETKSMVIAAGVLKKTYGNTVNINRFSKSKCSYMIDKLIEYGYLLYKKNDEYIISINSGQLNEFKEKINLLPKPECIPMYIKFKENEQKKATS